MILVFGSINVDLVARVDRIARPGETVLSPGYTLFHGGKGANQAVAAARSAPSGTSVFMCGAVGDDAFGENCRGNFAAEGIDLALLQTVEAPTGSAFIAVDAAGENAITVASGANLLLRADRLDDRILDAVGVAVLQMEVPLAQNVALAERLKAGKAAILLNFAPARVDLPRQDLRALLALVSCLVVNEHEASALGDALALDRNDGQALAEGLDVSVVVTLGADGVALYRPRKPAWRCDAVPVEVVDTTGAGDTFVGILAAGLDTGMSLEAAIERAALGASLSCTRLGAQAAMPRLSDLT